MDVSYFKMFKMFIVWYLFVPFFFLFVLLCFQTILKMVFSRVTSELMKRMRADDRVKLLEKFLKLCEHLFELNNLSRFLCCS